MGMKQNFLLVCVTAILCETNIATEAKKRGLFGKSTRLVMRANNLYHCPEPWNAFNITLSRSTLLKNAVYIHDFDVEIYREAPAVAMVNIKFVKCAEAVTTNTCEYYKSLDLPNVDICRAMKLKWGFWNHYFDDVTPPMACPIQPGFYQFRNATSDMDFLDSKGIPLENNIWVTTTTVHDKNSNPYTCLVHEAEFFRVHV